MLIIISSIEMSNYFFIIFEIFATYKRECEEKNDGSLCLCHVLQEAY